MTNPIAISAGVIAAAVIVTAAVVVYENNPEIRQHVDRIRRRFANAMSGRRFSEEDYDEFCEPMYNRPEDAEGFMMSSQYRSQKDSDDEYDEDDVTEETRIRQREELAYWKAIQESKEMDEVKNIADQEDMKEKEGRRSFDDCLKQDDTAEIGTFVYNSSAVVHQGVSGLRRRGENQSRAVYEPSEPAAPFADSAKSTTASPPDYNDHFRVQGDIYGAPPPVPMKEKSAAAPLVNMNSNKSDSSSDSSSDSGRVHTPKSVSVKSDPFSDAHAKSETAQSNNSMPFASIQAWAEGNEDSFYASMPSAPNNVPSSVTTGRSASVSMDDSEEMMTPTDGMSQAGSGVVIDNRIDSSSNAGSRYDVISQTDGMHTPASWSEIGSVVSDDDMHVPA